MQVKRLKIFSFLFSILFLWTATACDGDPGEPTEQYDYWANGILGSRNSSSEKYYYNFVTSRETQDGGYVIASNTQYTPTYTLLDSALIKFDSEGKVTWHKKYDLRSSMDYIIDMNLNDDGSYTLLGAAYSTSLGGDLYVMTVESNGDIRWQKGYDLGETAFAGKLLKTTGGYVFSGYGYTSANDNFSFLIKIDETGNLIWQKKYSLANGSALKATADNGFVLGAQNGEVLKLDANGEVVWANLYNSEGFKHNFRSLTVDANGDLVLLGNIAPAADDDEYDWLLMKLNDSGQVLWQKAYDGGDRDYSSNVNLGKDGGYIATGASESFDTDHKEDVWLIKFDNEGVPDWQKAYNISHESGRTVTSTSKGYYVSGSQSNDRGLHISCNDQGEIPEPGSSLSVKNTNATVRSTGLSGTSVSLVAEELSVTVIGMNAGVQDMNTDLVRY